MGISDLLYRLRALFRRNEMEAELDDELQLHLEKETEKLVARGIAPDEAVRRARLALGGAEQVKEECRDARGVRWIEEFARDCAHAWRTLRTNPVFAATATVTLALAIGANTAAFSAANALLFRALPVSDAASLVSVNNWTHPPLPDLSYPDMRDLRDRNGVLESMAGYRPTTVALSNGARSVRLWGYVVTGGYFPLLGVKPLLGRMISPDDDQEHQARAVVVLSYDCWQTQFGGDPKIAGRAVTINGQPYTIVGVAPRGFFGTEFLLNPDIWLPQTAPLVNRMDAEWLVVARVKPGVPAARAEAALQAVAAEIGREHPNESGGMRISLSPPGLVGETGRGPAKDILGILLCITGLVLLTGAANLACLLGARASERRREIAVRLALGAGRGRLVRQLLAESLLLSAAGGTAGALLAVWLTGLLAAWHPPTDMQLRADFSVDAHVLWFTAALALATTIGCGLAPALGATQQDLTQAIKGEVPRGRWRWWSGRDLLIAAQIAVSLVLLAGAALMAGGLRKAVGAGLGLNPEHAVTAAFDLHLQGYDEARGREFQRRLMEKLSARPGFDAVGLTTSIPMDVKYLVGDIHLEGQQAKRAADIPKALFYNVTPGYFQAAGVRLIAGRGFTEDDRKGAPWVAVVNQAFAQTVLHRAGPMGQRFRLGPSSGWIEIVGVVETGKHLVLGEDPKAAVYLSMLQNYQGAATVVARTRLPEAEAIGMIRDALHELDPALPVYRAESLMDHLAVALLPARVAAGALWSFGGLGLLLCATGIYGTVAYSVSRRRREIGIRMATGARAAQIVRLVVGRIAALLALGAVCGGVVAWVGGRSMLRIFFRQGAGDPVSLVVAIAALSAAAIAACWAPARRAATVDPATALRSE